MDYQQLLKDIFVVSPQIALLLIGLIPVLVKVMRGNREPEPFSSLAWGFIALICASGLNAAVSILAASKDTTAFGGALAVDGISVWVSYLIYLVAAVALMLAYDHVATRGKQFAEFVFLVLSAVIGMIIVIMSNDLIITFIGIEMMSLSLYILIAMSKEEVLSKESAFKYFVLGSFASAIFLYGIALVWGTGGTTQFGPLAGKIETLLVSEPNRLFIVGIVLIVLGFAFKVGLFPMHAWVPDVYQGASTPITTLMSTAVKTASFIPFLRLMNSPGFSGDDGKLQIAMIWIAAMTMLVGNVAAILQDNFKRVLAYSSVAHSGYAMVGLLAAGLGDKYAAGATSQIFYLFSYTIMTIGTFALVAVFEKYENTTLNVQDLKGLSVRHPVLALCLSILLLSLAGIPPTLGFFGKFYIFTAAMEQGLYWLVVWGIINSVISVYYYLRPVVMMYMSDEEPAEVLQEHTMTRMTVMASAILVVVLGLMSSPVLRAVQRAVTGLL